MQIGEKIKNYRKTAGLTQEQVADYLDVSTPAVNKWEKSFSGVGNNFVRALATEIENKEEYEFLKGNKELEAIFSQYLK